MEPLISIETVPISIEYSTSKAETRTKAVPGGSSNSASLSISRGNNQLMIRSNPINIQLQDRFEHNNGGYMAYTATAKYTNDGVLSMNVRIQNSQDNSVPDGANRSRFPAAGKGIDSMVDAVPKTRTGSPASPFVGLKINFNMANVKEAPRNSEVETSFVPPDIEVNIVEYPKVIIKYVGGPIYFPRSSDPNYEPPEVANFQAEV
ncbi:hypothetical protein FACS1894127_3770 [Clostridia bacterium]|nr:hypothetical protein FACS1894127_3770 [Clostridia bacterium]